MFLAARTAFPAAQRSPWANVADPVFIRIDQATLPHPAVYAVAQDAVGFIWVGTPSGLARYDGYQFRTFLPGPADPNAPNGVQALVAAPDEKLWIGTPSSGLASLDERTERFQAWHADPNGRTGPRSATVIALARTVDGKLWIGGDSGLDVFDPATNTFHSADLGAGDERQPRVEAILIDREQTVWVATVRGLFQRSRSDAAFQRVDSRSCFSLYEDANGRLWSGSTGAVSILGADRRIAKTYALAGEQWGIIEVTPGVFWVAAYDGGISIVDTVAQHIRRIAIDRANPGGFTPGDVWEFFRDRSGLIWIANGPGGLLVHNPLNRGIFELASIDKGLGAGDLGARAVAAAPHGDLWLGGSDRVVRVDPQKDALSTFTVPDRRSVQTLSVAADGTLWIGTVQGLCRLHPHQRSIDCPSGFYRDVGRVFAIAEDAGTLWVGTGTGVFALNERRGTATQYRHSNARDSLSNDFVTVVYADREGRIWAGTSNGLNRIDPPTERVTRFAV
ncbi:MAG TPA: two-component regulator propeller domain-containing protein, partial [Thermoanaerobaculia bacterium]